MKNNLYILSILSLIFIISCKDDEPAPVEPTVVTGCTDPTASNYNADATEDDGSCITASGVFYQLPNLNSGAITFEEVDGIVYGPSALEDGSFDPEYEFDEDNTGGHWGVFGEVETDGVVTGENPTMAYVANPDTNGNDSSTIVEITKKANSQKWSGVYFDFAENFVFPADKQALKIDFWSPEAGLEVRIKVETALLQSDDNFATTGEITSNVINGVVAGWNTLTFNMPEGNTEGYNRLVIIPSIKVAVTEDVKYYFDNIDYSAPGEPEPVNVTLDLTFENPFDGVTYDETTSTYTFPSTGAQDWAGVSNSNDTMYPLDFSEAGAIQFTGAAPNGDVDVRFRFEYNPYPDTEPSYNTVAVTVSGETETTYTVLVPSQGANTFSSVIMYLDTRDIGVVVKDAKVVKDYDLGLSFDNPFDGLTYDETTSTYTFPSTGAQDWAGVSNSNDAIYPITLSSDMEVRFTGAAPNGDVNVRFRFEYNPYPDTEPSYNTVAVTVTGATETTYSVPVPSQGANTFSSVIMYLDTRDIGVVVKDVGIHNAPNE